ncbi:BBP7 family outer membrane beta-barrel protein [Anatilimnocola aggregata]|nr:BBP7 family outer membrane beta-barrel protein [Anatilimnocola aggregata]
MNCRWAWMLPLLSIVTLMLGDQSVQAQGPPGMMGPGGPPPGMMGGPPGMMGGPPGMMGPGGPPGMMGGPPPGMYDPDSMNGAGIMGPGGPPGSMMGPSGDMMGGCPPEGGGYGHRHNGLLGDVLGIIAPYSDGGCAAPRWFDFDVGVMSIRRDDVGNSRVFTVQDDGVNPPVTVLQTSDLDFDSSTSFKFSAMMQCGPGSNLEFTYFGLFGWTSTAQALGNNDLFSVYSQFGTDPAGGFPETDASDIQRITYFSTFDNFEVNFRQRWQSPNCRYQGSWLYGVRYFKLDEDFNYNTLGVHTDLGPPIVVTTDTSRTNVNTNNSLTGLQIGGDMWVCLIPGLRVGGEGKFGVYGNHQNIDTTITTSTGLNFQEELRVGDVAFIGDLAAYATYRINYNWTFKAGYQALYVEGVALASENFNPVPPNVFVGGSQTRVPTAFRNGNVFYHGYTASFEYLW